MRWTRAEVITKKGTTFAQSFEIVDAAHRWATLHIPTARQVGISSHGERRKAPRVWVRCVTPDCIYCHTKVESSLIRATCGMCNEPLQSVT